eukprot:TRINITY_DN6333_c0_g1_i4.p1 TRINITY_DN6333_c0_g1~~TRINITY_DN6333_c0_g1_i4.p1  ORF type:complete len:601 (+),score=70.59 TRINITY_DN6333_c0_g1_i4:64-1866(+)
MSLEGKGRQLPVPNVTNLSRTSSVESASSTASTAHRRRSALNAWLELERKYVKALEHVQNDYRKAFVELPVLDEKLFKSVFSPQWMAIANKHRHLLEILEHRLRHYGTGCVVGDLLTRLDASGAKGVKDIYITFASNVRAVIGGIEEACAESSRLRYTLQDLQGATRQVLGAKQGLGNLLLRPIDHFADMHECITTIFDNTDELHPDAVFLPHTLVVLERLSIYVSEAYDVTKPDPVDVLAPASPTSTASLDIDDLTASEPHSILEVTAIPRRSDDSLLATDSSASSISNDPEPDTNTSRASETDDTPGQHADGKDADPVVAAGSNDLTQKGAVITMKLPEAAEDEQETPPVPDSPPLLTRPGQNLSSEHLERVQSLSPEPDSAAQPPIMGRIRTGSLRSSRKRPDLPKKVSKEEISQPCTFEHAAHVRPDAMVFGQVSPTVKTSFEQATGVRSHTTSPNKSVQRSKSFLNKGRSGSFRKSNRRNRSGEDMISTPIGFQHVTHVGTDEAMIDGINTSMNNVKASDLASVRPVQAQELINKPFESIRNSSASDLLSRSASGSSSVRHGSGFFARYGARSPPSSVTQTKPKPSPSRLQDFEV